MDDEEDDEVPYEGTRIEGDDGEELEQKAEVGDVVALVILLLLLLATAVVLAVVAAAVVVVAVTVAVSSLTGK